MNVRVSYLIFSKYGNKMSVSFYLKCATRCSWGWFFFHLFLSLALFSVWKKLSPIKWGERECKCEYERRIASILHYPDVWIAIQTLRHLCIFKLKSTFENAISVGFSFWILFWLVFFSSIAWFLVWIFLEIHYDCYIISMFMAVNRLFFWCVCIW